jgi:hypothetical protein
MAQCPVCAAEVLEDFGSTECASCGAQLLIHVDGTIETMDRNEEPSAPEFREPEPVFEDEPGQDNPGYVDEIATEDEPNAPAEFTQPHGPKPDIFADEEEAQVPNETVYRIPSAPADSPDLSDIARFGNSEASSGRDGALRYNLRIHGIDTVDVREALREALTDRKFLWDTDQILRSIRNGEVQIANVAASKAYMLITRLRSLPVKVKWEQYAVHQP